MVWTPAYQACASIVAVKNDSADDASVVLEKIKVSGVGWVVRQEASGELVSRLQVALAVA